VLKAETHLPVIVDPSHAAGKRQLVAPLALAAVAAGADGLIVETHPNPEHALSDAAQQIPSSQFKRFVDEVESYLAAAGKTLSR
jgi:3-deoxy-7-phosphoheptulonate synthase